jgi:hypothetical protein
VVWLVGERLLERLIVLSTSSLAEQGQAILSVLFRDGNWPAMLAERAAGAWPQTPLATEEIVNICNFTVNSTARQSSARPQAGTLLKHWGVKGARKSFAPTSWPTNNTKTLRLAFVDSTKMRPWCVGRRVRGVICHPFGIPTASIPRQMSLLSV